MKDKTGYEIPPAIIDDWKAAQGYQTLITKLQSIKDEVAAGVDNDGLIYREIGKDTYIDIGNAIRSLKRLLPYAVCPTCQGRVRDNCTLCKQRGWISKFLWDNCVTVEMKEMRTKITGQQGESIEHGESTTSI
jgi:hypothetical protein